MKSLAAVGIVHSVIAMPKSKLSRALPHQNSICYREAHGMSHWSHAAITVRLHLVLTLYVKSNPHASS
jgi:enoyl-[acyl-carrier-protein] reductase (NADH)